MDPELRRAVQTLALAGRGLERAAAPLTLPQYRVLALVASAPERASRLATQVDVTKAALTGVLDALEVHGWIERAVVAGDRRGVSLTVTATGAAALESAEEAMGAWLAEVLGSGPGDTTTTDAEASRAVLRGLCALGGALGRHRRQRMEDGVGAVGGRR